jgi:tetratricopeptide (TPR) repeat protein
MKRLLPAFLLVFCASPAAADSALQEARQRWLKGNYDEAREQYEALLKDPKHRADAAAGLSRALQSLGEYDRAVAVVEDALKDSTKDPVLLARYAEILYLRGRWDEAQKAADTAVEADKNQFLARWVQVQLLRDRGDVQKADAGGRWFVRTYTKRSDAGDDIKDPDQLLTVALAGAENARWNHLADQFGFIVNEVCADAVKADKDFWPAEYMAGSLLLEKFNKPEAEDAFDKALKINPAAAEALVGKGTLALMGFQIKQAERFAEQALKVNPKLPEALRLRADVHLASGDPAAALRELQTARAVNPRDEYTLARIAACLRLQRKKDQADALAKDVEKFDAKPAVFWYELGERLEDRRYFEDAEACYRKAAELRPILSGPANSLGMLYMRLGREKDAAELLEKGFAADPFNVRVNNTRKVLKHLQKYETLRTDHFELRFDPGHDAAQARWMAGYLEDVYRDLAGKFDYRPQGPILIEVFNSHEMFSGRVVALPDLHTIGACTGRMVAMASPHAKGVAKPFNWARVLRHELVHIFNLEQTHFLVPHWLTEGLAVSNEGFPRPGIWNQILRERFVADKLLDLDTVDLGFIRPSGPEEWNLAYCQSQLYVEYAKKTHGDAVVGALLAAYADGLNTADVIARACKTDKASFEKGYREYVAGVVKSLRLGKPPSKPRSTKDLKASFDKGDDLEAGAELAMRMLDRGDAKAARFYADEVRKARKNHAKAEYVLARLARLAGNEAEERSWLEGIADKESEPRVLKALGQIYYDAEEYGKAAEVFEQGRKAQPDESDWLAQLARVYARKDDKAKLIAVLEELVPTDADDFDSRLRLARLLLEKKQPDKAERYARQALEVDVASEEARDVLVQALRKQNKEDEARRVESMLGKK